MAIQDDNTILNKGDLKAYHQKILPYLGGNMMVSTNNSDYYSTEEKVVGVWIDGKPLYQKVITDTFPTSGNTKYVDIGESIDWVDADVLVKNADGVMQKLTSAKFISGEVPEWSLRFASLLNNNASNPNKVQLTNIGGTNYNNQPVYIIIQYTKTTDTAGSATTTPGAYDINFPNTWPENTEIYFGNGLYGQRFTGNFTATATNSRFADTLSTTLPSSTRIVSSGGNITATSVSGNQLWDFPLNSSAPSSTENFIQIPTGLWFGISTKQLRFGVRPMGDWKLTTSNTYDVWVTYTK